MKKGEVGIVATFGAVGVVFAVIAFIVQSVVAKWIWGVLSVLVIGFTLIMLIDAIVKNRRRPKDLSELLMTAMKEAANSPDFAQKMEEASRKRDILFEGQRTEEPDYGFSTSNPIMSSTISRSEEYLGKLRTLNGESFTWERTGSRCMADVHGVENVMVDAYQLYLNGMKYKMIYICPYGHSSSFVPKGMKLSE